MNYENLFFEEIFQCYSWILSDIADQKKFSYV